MNCLGMEARMTWHKAICIIDSDEKVHTGWGTHVSRKGMGAFLMRLSVREKVSMEEAVMRNYLRQRIFHTGLKRSFIGFV